MKRWSCVCEDFELRKRLVIGDLKVESVVGIERVSCGVRGEEVVGIVRVRLGS